MPCALTMGVNLDCRDGIGGLKEVYLIEVGNISAVTEASGVITAITKLAGKRFFKYSLIRATSTYTDTLTVSEENGTIFAAQTLNLIINSRTASIRNEIMLLGKNNVAAVVVDNTGKAWLLGREYGLVLNAAAGGPGTAWADRNGWTLPFAGNEKELAPEVQASLIATLETPGP